MGKPKRAECEPFNRVAELYRERGAISAELRREQPVAKLVGGKRWEEWKARRAELDRTFQPLVPLYICGMAGVCDHAEKQKQGGCAILELVASRPDYAEFADTVLGIKSPGATSTQ